ncbi:MAG: zinc ABC transporter substrate-binding protein [Rhizobiales bacterium]|nr:zinc ABC transporter substrate-binding protein [Hyphomicrobiales bacterium]
MRSVTRFGLAFILALAASPAARAADGKIAVVAAENFYGDIARQIGGDRVSVTSIMNNPDQDPHLFETTPGIVKRIAAAQVVIFNGADYDTWMEKLLAAAPRPGRLEINVATLTNRKAGDNPHLWYDLTTMPAVARALNAALAKADSAHAQDYDARLSITHAALDRVTQRVAQLKAKHAGKPVTASEPVFGPMAGALGLTMRNERFQLSIMNDTEPSARDIAAFEQDLKERKVRAMFYNKQASSKIVQRLVELARTAKVPVVGVTETQPATMSFQDWMLDQLDETDKALAGPHS